MSRVSASATWPTTMAFRALRRDCEPLLRALAAPLAWGLGGVFGPTLAGRIADASGSYAGAYHIAAVLLTAACFLAMLSYVSVSVSVSEKEVRIRVGERAA